MKVPSSFFAYRASNFVLENLSTYAGGDADGNYDGDANCVTVNAYGQPDCKMSGFYAFPKMFYKFHFWYKD